MKRFIVICLSILLLLSAGCTTRGETTTNAETPAPVIPTESPKPTETPKPVETPKPTEEPQPTEEPIPIETPTPEPEYRNFFNGTPLDAPCYDRPFAVMVNNIKAALPQCGISHADIIYEVLAEGGVTRMMAIFSDIQSADNLGSIRSIRPYYIDISLGYGAVTCHAGGSDDAYSRIRKEQIENIDGVRGTYPVTVFHRDSVRLSSGYATEHTLFTDGSKLYECADKLGYSLTLPEDYQNGLNFVKNATPENGKEANKINIVFNSGKSTGLQFHEDIGLYTASQYGGDYDDGNTKEAVTFQNVIAIYAPSKVLDNYGRLSINLFYGGEGYFACGGKYEEITWSRENVNDCFHYFLKDGTELQVGEGTTYIAVLALNQSTISFD